VLREPKWPTQAMSRSKTIEIRLKHVALARSHPQGLNVLIGPNGSGKSNLIEAISLLQSAPSALASPVRDGGGIRDWLWKGLKKPVASVEIVADNPVVRPRIRTSV
jgi:predicted ATPase